MGGDGGYGDEDRGTEQWQVEGERPVGVEEVRRGGRGVAQRGAEEMGRRLGAEAQRPCRKGTQKTMQGPQKGIEAGLVKMDLSPLSSA